MPRQRVSGFCGVPQEIIHLAPANGLLWKECWPGAEGGRNCVLGEIGGEDALRTLRERMALVGKKYYELVVAVGKLKKRLGVKKEVKRWAKLM